MAGGISPGTLFGKRTQWWRDLGISENPKCQCGGLLPVPSHCHQRGYASEIRDTDWRVLPTLPSLRARVPTAHRWEGGALPIFMRMGCAPHMRFPPPNRASPPRTSSEAPTVCEGCPMGGGGCAVEPHPCRDRATAHGRSDTFLRLRLSWASSGSAAARLRLGYGWAAAMMRFCCGSDAARLRPDFF